MNKTQKNNIDNLKESILARIDRGKVEQVPRWVFVFKNASFWSLWIMGIVVGAAAVAAIIFSAEHGGWEFYEATHKNIFTFLVEMLPYLWMVILVGTVLLGYYNLRHTKSGYRYSLRTLVFVSVAGSLFFGMVLFISGAGAFIELTIGNHIPFNRSVVMVQRDMWRVPEEGRLVGIVMGNVEDDEVLFEDIAGTSWILRTTQASERDLELLERNTEVRLLGYRATSTESGEHVFFVCIVLPGPAVKGKGFEDIFVQRGEFTERIARLARDEINEEGLRSNECESVRPHAPVPAY